MMLVCSLTNCSATKPHLPGSPDGLLHGLPSVGSFLSNTWMRSFPRRHKSCRHWRSSCSAPDSGRRPAFCCLWCSRSSIPQRPWRLSRRQDCFHTRRSGQYIFQCSRQRSGHGPATGGSTAPPQPVDHHPIAFISFCTLTVSSPIDHLPASAQPLWLALSASTRSCFSQCSRSRSF